MQPPASLLRVWLPLLLTVAACGGPRLPRPTLLDLPPPVPPPGADEARLMPVDLRPDAREPLETVPAPSIHAMARRALDDRQGALVACYERALLDHPDAAGRVEVQLDLAATGAVARAHLDHRADGGFEVALPCLEEVFRGVRVRDVPTGGQYVSRVYTFRSPTLERVVAAPVVVLAPPLPVRARRRRRGAPAPVAPPAPPAAAPALRGPGSLRADELSRGLAAAPGLPACATLALRRARRAPAPVTVHLAVARDGAVTEATPESTPPLAAPVAACVTEAARAVRYRASGIALRATLTLVLRR